MLVNFEIAQNFDSSRNAAFVPFWKSQLGDKAVNPIPDGQFFPWVRYGYRWRLHRPRVQECHSHNIDNRQPQRPF